MSPVASPDFPTPVETATYCEVFPVRHHPLSVAPVIRLCADGQGQKAHAGG